MDSSATDSSSDTSHEPLQQPLEQSPAERHSLKTSEVVYAVSALVIGVLLFFTAF